MSDLQKLTDELLKNPEFKKEYEAIKPLTDEEKKMLEALKDRPITFDEESPESTPAMLKALEAAAMMRDGINVTKHS